MVRSWPPEFAKIAPAANRCPPGFRKTRMPDAFVSQLPHHSGYG